MTRKTTAEYSDSNTYLNPVLNPAGFSLIEVVLATAILSIGILSAMQMGLLATQNITSGNIVTEAVLLAQSEIEKIRSHHSLIDLAQTFSSDSNPYDYLHIAYQFMDPYDHELEDPVGVNCETSTFAGSGTCLAAVTVSWRRGGGGRGGKGTVQLKTLLGGSV